MADIDVLVIGAGPAGLCAALELAKAGRSVTVLEADLDRVGGISRTVEHNGYLFDIGGHRFFSKSAEVNRLWREILPDDLVERPRLSRIFYKGRLYSYPLDPLQALRNLGPVESLRCVASFLRARLRPVAPVASFEDWVVNAFGRRLYGIFFKTYSEKVWGMPCSDISADWAAQRIKGLDLGVAVLEALKGALGVAGKRRPKTLINSFLYPRRGPGMMWAAAAERVVELGGRVLLGRRVGAVSREGGAWVVTAGDGETYRANHLVSTTGMRDLAGMVLGAGDPLLAHADALRYRDYAMVALVFDRPAPFGDNWLYVHDPDVTTGRIQNFGSWSPDMLGRPGTSCLGFEYFCGEGDEIWSSSDEDLKALALADLGKLGFWDGALPFDFAVVRQPKAYPVYDAGFKDRVERLRNAMEARFPTLHFAGRNGMHRYNNQDHAMVTGLLAARNIMAGDRSLDPWRVNDDAEYVEAGEVPLTYSPAQPRMAPATGRGGPATA